MRGEDNRIGCVRLDLAAQDILMKLFVVVLCYRVVDLTIDCLRSLAGEIGRVPGAKVGLLENGTGDDSAERLRKAIRENGWSSWVEFTEVYPNRGFTGGNNLLIRPALESADPPEYVLLLNSDTIVKEHALDALVEFMDKNPRVGIAGSQMLWPDGSLRASPFRFPGIATELDRGLKLGVVSKLLSRWSIEPPKPTVSTRWDWVSGASMVLRTRMLDQIGLLDEGLYTYFDDIDICLRARKAGWETWYVVASKVIHLGGASTGVTAKSIGRRPSYWFEARRRFFLKSYGKAYTALADAAFILGYALWHVRRRLQRKADTDPKQFLIDSIRHSVFCTGFRLRDVENPAMKAAMPIPGRDASRPESSPDDLGAKLRDPGLVRTS
jgi:N-acetylglucosaminyl-diphospho-decaprenol L-rhamnosyltransferase